LALCCFAGFFNVVVLKSRAFKMIAAALGTFAFAAVKNFLGKCPIKVAAKKFFMQL